MTTSSYAISAYQAAILTTPPLQRVVMLYDGVLRAIASARAAAERQDYETQFNDVMKAARIINGLNSCLDMEQGGQVAQNLRDMYQSLVTALLSSVGRPTGAEALRRLSQAVLLTRDAWAEIAGSSVVEAPQSDAAAFAFTGPSAPEQAHQAIAV